MGDIKEEDYSTKKLNNVDEKEHINDPRKFTSKEIPIFERIKYFEEESHFSIYVGAGLYQICIGLLLSLLVSFIISLPAIMAYPYLSHYLYWSLWIFGWSLIILGSLTLSFPFLKNKLGADEDIIEALMSALKLNAIFITLFIPIGLFLGLSLKLELEGCRKATYREDAPSISMHFKPKKIPPLFYFMVITGISHILLGLLFLLIPNLITRDLYLLGYPYINLTLLSIIELFGWISLISGTIVLFLSFSSWKLHSVDKIDGLGNFLRIIRHVIIIASVFLCLVFPIGTFFGLTLIFEILSIKKRES